MRKTKRVREFYGRGVGHNPKLSEWRRHYTNTSNKTFHLPKESAFPSKFPELTEMERKVLQAYAEYAAVGRRPSLSKVRAVVGVGAHVIPKILVDLHLKGAVLLVESGRGRWLHAALHPKAWEELGVTPSPPPAPMTRAVYQLLHPTARVIHAFCVKWFSVFKYWPEPRDLGVRIHKSDECIRLWLVQLSDMDLVGYSSNRAKY